jgi:hypothetical protein
MAIGMSDTLCGKDPQNCEDPFATACRWMLYLRRHRSTTGESIPVSQQMLEFRERALCYLRLLDRRGELRKKLQSLVQTPPRPWEASIGEEMTGGESRKSVKPYPTVAQNEHMRIGNTHMSVSATTKTSSTVSAVPAHGGKQGTVMQDKESKLEQSIVDGTTVEKQEPMSQDKRGNKRECAVLATPNIPLRVISSDVVHTDDDNGKTSNIQPTAPAVQLQSSGPMMKSTPHTRRFESDLPTPVNEEIQRQTI